MSCVKKFLASIPAGSVVDRFDIGAGPERLGDLPSAFRTDQLMPVIRALTRGGDKVWLHQAKALTMLGRGDNVVLATGTGSGKTLVFQAEMVRQFLADPDATGFALYPTKALAWDQLVRWRSAFAAAGLSADSVAEVNGSTSFIDRDAVLARARLIIGTEDIVHAWFMRMVAAPDAQRFARNLAFVVIDEAHDLEGVFGSNCALLFRRLRAARNRSRGAAALPENELRFVAASATIADPAGHLQDLTGLPFNVVSEEDNGAPRQAKTLLHIEGPEFGQVAESALASLIENLAGKIAPDSLIAFADGRKVVENVASTIARDDVEPFRAGFEPEDRSEIAAGMHNGSLRAIVSTSALELGIDVPQFAVGLSLGVPMSRKAFRQRVGRVGRSGPGVFAVIAEPSAFAKLGTSLRDFYVGVPERSSLYLENPIVQVQNACCLFEECGGADGGARLPADIDWPNGFADAFGLAHPAAIRPAEIDHVLAHGGSGSPHRDYPLRRIGDGKFALRAHRGDGEIIGTIDDGKALREAYPGGTYRHRKTAYKVIEWRSTAYERSIYLQKTSGYSRTSPILLTQVGVSHAASEVLDGHLKTSASGSLAEVRMQVAETVIGFRSGNTDHLYKELVQRDRRLSRKQRNFSTSGVVIRIDELWFRGRGGAAAEARDRIGKALATILTRERGVAAGEVRWECSGIALHEKSGPRLLDDALVIFDDLCGGLRLTAPLFDEFAGVLGQLGRGARMAGTEALLDEITILRLMNWHKSLESSVESGSEGTLGSSGQRLIFAPGSHVAVRINGELQDRRLKAHQLVTMSDVQHLMYSYETSPGVFALVPHEQVEPIGHDWRYLLWDPATGEAEEIAA
ncbi:DEAD/DEAH box helicase [Altererythrobacter sp. TH136]|uniref:DEAD/DEAH box helicase n=1 Tax=Altererythrobacter sp. TH136 TaxID=2067415 RepID=UPI0011639C1E|nr:DEAD/DEAH box helicase [Altererythrobacter sp. TH136]QDM40387.1 DEAD/DEAH box helicase [Altererythrobacter sp. TH136]